MSLRGELCFRISKALRKPPEARELAPDCYSDWRADEMRRRWSHFSNGSVDGKDVLDFGCGEGPLSLYLALTAAPHSVVGVDLSESALERAKASVARQNPGTLSCVPEFRVSRNARIPAADSSADTILAFDCMEHVMDPAAIMAEWRRVLRPQGRVLVEWSPFKGPWGAHMHALVPLPWAHVLFGERALFEAAERIYDDPDYVPRHWDYDGHGRSRPNPFRALRSFGDAGYLNELDVTTFRRMAAAADFAVERLERQPLGSYGVKRRVGQTLLAFPFVREYATSFIIAELERQKQKR